MKLKSTIKKSKSLGLMLGIALLSNSVFSQTISITSSTPVTTSFEGWAGTMPSGYVFSGTGTAFSSGTPPGYKGTNPTNTAGGVYSCTGGGFGYQPASSASALTVTGTYTNNTGATISNLDIEYDAILINPVAGRAPEWNVYLNGTLIPELTWNSVTDPSPETKTVSISGLSIPDGTDFTIAFESDRGLPTGASPKIGFDNVTVTNGAPLSVDLGKVIAYKQGNTNVIEFSSLSEVNENLFFIEKSENGRNFSTLSTIKANGTPSNYEAIDQLPFSTTYYRVKMMDQTTGKINYSKIVKVNNTQAGAQVSLFPNPTQDWVNIEIKGTLPADANVVIFDALGRIMYSNTINENEILKIDVSNYAKGLYQVVFQNGNQLLTKPFIVR